MSAPKTYDEVQSRSGRWGSRLTITMTAEFLQQAQTVGSDISMNLVTSECKLASFLPFIYCDGFVAVWYDGIVSGVGASLVALIGCLLKSSGTAGQLASLKLNLILSACGLTSSGASA